MIPQRVIKSATKYRKKLEKALNATAQGRHVTTIDNLLLSDIADHIRLYKYIEQNKAGYAFDTYTDMDTWPREELSNVVIDYMEDYATDCDWV